MAYRQLDLRTANPVGAAIQSYKDMNSIFTEREDRKRAEEDRQRRKEREDILWARADELYTSQKEDRIRQQQLENERIAREVETHDLKVKKTNQEIKQAEELNPLAIKKAKADVKTSQNASEASTIALKKAKRGVIDEETQRILIPVKARLEQIKTNAGSNLQERNDKTTEYINSLDKKTLNVLKNSMSKADFEAIRTGQQLAHLGMSKLAEGDSETAAKYIARALNLTFGDDINRGQAKEGFSLIHKEVSPNFSFLPDGRVLPKISVMAKNDLTGGIETYEAPSTVGQDSGMDAKLNVQAPDEAIKQIDYLAKIADAVETRLYGSGHEKTIKEVDARGAALTVGKSKENIINKFAAVYNKDDDLATTFTAISKIAAEEVEASKGKFSPSDGDALVSETMKMATQDSKNLVDRLKAGALGGSKGLKDGQRTTIYNMAAAKLGLTAAATEIAKAKFGNGMTTETFTADKWGEALAILGQDPKYAGKVKQFYDVIGAAEGSFNGNIEMTVKNAFAKVKRSRLLTAEPTPENITQLSAYITSKAKTRDQLVKSVEELKITAPKLYESVKAKLITPAIKK